MKNINETQRLPMPRFKITAGKTLLLFLLFIVDNIEPVFSQCSGSNLVVTTSNDFQYVTSPGYNNGGGNYQSNMVCTWILDTGASDTQVMLYVDYDVTCPGDVINIYDGETSSSTALKTGLCGTGKTVVYSSTQRYVRVDFTSDGSNQGAGFSIAYLGSKDLSGSGCSSTQTLAASKTTQYLSSPGFPGLYTLSSNCRWTITAPNGTVSLDLFFSDIEWSTNCAFDSLKIYDGNFVCDELRIVSACTPHPSGNKITYNSNGSSITVKFAADGSLSYHGFILKYTQLYEEPVTTVSASAATEDRFYLGFGIGFGSGAAAAFFVVGVIALFKSLFCKSRAGSPRVKQVEPLSIRVPSSRNDSISGSSISDDSSRPGCLCSTPISPNTSVVVNLTKRQNGINGFLRQQNSLENL